MGFDFSLFTFSQSLLGDLKQIRMIFLVFNWNFLYFNLCPLSHHLEKSGFFFFTPSHQVFIHTDKILLHLLFPKLSSPSPCVRHFKSLSIVVTLCRTGGAENSTHHRWWVPRKAEGSPPSTCSQSSTYCSLGARRPLLPGCLVAQCSFGPYLNLFLPRSFPAVWSTVFLLLNFTGFLPAYFSSLLKPLWPTSKPLIPAFRPPAKFFSDSMFAGWKLAIFPLSLWHAMTSYSCPIWTSYLLQSRFVSCSISPLNPCSCPPSTSRADKCPRQ